MSESDDQIEPPYQKRLTPRGAQEMLRAVWDTLYERVQELAREVVGEEIPAPPADAPPLPRPIPDSPLPHERYPGAVPRDGYISFILYAPGKQNVALAGNFNGWSQTAHPMKSIGDGLWWVGVQLPPGYWLYQFVVDGWLWICDPYAREVEWDGYGPKAVLDNERPAYRWGDGGYHTRPLQDAILYELHVGDFSPEGTFEGVRRRLDYIQSLGVTAIQLMPICEFPTDHSWGYNPAFYFAPERAYGRPHELKRLVDEAHQRGIAVVLDMVFNHTQEDNPINRLWPYHENPYFTGGGNPWGMPDFNHFSDVTKSYMRDIQAFWLTEYHIDGFRYDATAYIQSDEFNGIGFLTWAARQVKGDAWLISEHLPQDPYWVHNTEMDAQWHDHFHDMMKAQLREGPFEGGRQWGDLDGIERVLDYRHDGYHHPSQVINYTASHDEQRVIHEALSNPYITREIAHRKAALGMAATLMAPGVPMLYAGEEMAMDAARSTAPVKLDWWRLEQEGGAQWLCAMWRRLTWLRNTHPALRSATYRTLAKWYEHKAIAFQRWTDQGDVVVVALNFSNELHHVTLTFPHAGRWHEYLYEYTLETGSDGTATIELPPSGAKLYCLWRNW